MNIADSYRMPPTHLDEQKTPYYKSFSEYTSNFQTLQIYFMIIYLKKLQVKRVIFFSIEKKNY